MQLISPNKCFNRERVLEAREELKTHVKENNNGVKSTIQKSTEIRAPLGPHKVVQGNNGKGTVRKTEFPLTF